MSVSLTTEQLSQLKRQWRSRRGLPPTGHGGTSRGTVVSGSTGTGLQSAVLPDAHDEGPGTEYEKLAVAFALAIGHPLGCGACAAMKSEMNALYAREGVEGMRRERERMLSRLRDNLEKAEIKWDAAVLARVAWTGAMEGLAWSMVTHLGDAVAVMYDESVRRATVKTTEDS